MSNYRSCYLTVKGISPMKQAALEAALMSINVFEIDAYIDKKQNTIEYATSDSVDWDTEDSDMCKLSTLFPNAVFQLETWSADYCDKYFTYYKNGESEYCPLVPVAPKHIAW